ncbi:hypothetical protein [Micromonospora fulviviridis]|uniref:hypothetical protein n=1 Tax=Micromonospora fulviviridis TaxID=47860 RepID=UPI00379CD8C7
MDNFTGRQTMRDLTVRNVHTYYVVAGNTPVLVHNCGTGGESKPLVIGENMERVKQYANEIGGYVWRPWKNGDADLAMVRNERMIRDAMRAGRQIIDIGPDFARRAAGRAPSDYYSMERRVTDGYDGYTKAFETNGRLSGGVSGIDL